jgi:hypothetical protein
VRKYNPVAMKKRNHPEPPVPEKAQTRERGLSRAEVAKITGLKPHHLANLALTGGGPPYRKLRPGKRGSCIYLESEVENWLRGLPMHGGSNSKA